MRLKRIVCGVDFSQSSVTAFNTAVELVRLTKAELHVLHVIEAYPVVSEWLPIGAREDAILVLEEKARGAMEALIATIKEGFIGTRVTTEITMGRAHVEIINRARDKEADIIILGAKGLTLPEEAFSGTTAERVMKGAASSVLIVRR
jgi:nucleotide-binding universal stress UspA family protein